MSARRIFWCLTACVISSFTFSADVLADVVKWRNSIDTAKVEAAQSGRLVLVHFWTPSCGPCRKLDKDVFSQPQIAEMLEANFVPVKINADLSPALASYFNITRVPTDIVLTSQGNVLAPLSCPMKPAGYATQLLNLVQHYKQSTAASNTQMQPPVQSAYAGLKVGEYRNSAPTAPAVQNNQYQAAAQPPQQPAAPVASAPQVTTNIYASQPAAPQAPATAANTNPPQYPAGQRYAAVRPQPTGPAQNTLAAQQPQPATQQQQQPAVSQPPVASQPAQQPTQTAQAAPAVVTNNHVAASQPVQKPSQQQAAPQLPEGSAPLAFEGYCPVTLKQNRKWVKGNAQFGANHRGRTYLFAGEQQRQQFLANPDTFSPVFSGKDAVKLLEENLVVEGSRKYGYEYRGSFYLFGSKETMDRFASRPDHYAAGVRQAMTRMDATTGNTIRR